MQTSTPDERCQRALETFEKYRKIKLKLDINSNSVVELYFLSHGPEATSEQQIAESFSVAFVTRRASPKHQPNWQQ